MHSSNTDFSVQYSGWHIFMPPYLDWLETIALHLQMISLPLQSCSYWRCHPTQTAIYRSPIFGKD